MADDGGPDDEQGETDVRTPYGVGLADDHDAFRAQRSDGHAVLSVGVAAAKHVVALARQTGRCWRAGVPESACWPGAVCGTGR